MTTQETSRDYDDLTPQTVLDALDAVGFRGDGRVLQLNSYENRVFQVFLEDGEVVVSKFYRPARWSDEQILEEHALAIELFDAEVPVIPPLPLHLRDAPRVASSTSPSPAPTTALLGTPATLACQREGGVHRYAVSTRCAGREPELEAPETLRQIGRFIGRLHAVGERRPFLHRHVMRPQLDGQKARALLIDGGFLPETAQTAWDSELWPHDMAMQKRPTFAHCVQPADEATDLAQGFRRFEFGLAACAACGHGVTVHTPFALAG